MMQEQRNKSLWLPLLLGGIAIAFYLGSIIYHVLT